MRAFPFLCLLIALLPTGAWSQTILRNDRYSLSISNDGVVAVTTEGMPTQILRPEFTVIFGATNPGMTRLAIDPNYYTAPRDAVRWNNKKESLESLNTWLADPKWQAATGMTGTVTEKDGAREWEFRNSEGDVIASITGPHAWETSRPFTVGHTTMITAAHGSVNDRTVAWDFTPQPDFDFHAQLDLPLGKADPEIRYTITPKKAGYFSVAFTGAPAVDLPLTLPIPQETDARDHKLFNFVMSEPDLHLPRAQITTRQGNIALTVDPSECRFRLPAIGDSRFGVMLWEDGGKLRPVILAPLFGGAESSMSVGTPWNFTLRYVQLSGDWKQAYVHIARDIHGFRDERDNTGSGSLNGTIERVMDFLADRRGGNRAMWDPQQKYYDYFTDKTGIFKPFSPLYGLSAAIVTDDEDFFEKRGLPAVEFAVSRRSDVFAPYDNSNNKQANTAVRSVGAPYLGYAQLLSLYDLLQKQTPAFLDLAEKHGPEKGNVADALARWQLTGDAEALAEARRDAAKLRGRSERDFFDLLDVADATGDASDISAAVNAAYANAAEQLNLYPVPPDATVTVDKDGKGPIHQHSFSRHKNIWGYPIPQPIAVPEQTVPDWRIARLGVPSPAYPMEYWMNTHGATLHAAGLGGDTFLRDIAHWGVVGRFGNYAGDNRSKDSLVAELPEAVEAPPWDWNFATVNPGHAWDFAGAMIDFLVSDAFERSGCAIDFPALRAAGSSFRVRIYGGGPGKFYGDQGVYLWLPHGLITTDNRQVDWLAGHGNGQLYLALWNQSFKAETVVVTIDPALAKCDSSKPARVWTDNKPSSAINIADNRFTITLSPKGITAFAIPAETKPRLQARLYDSSVPKLGADSFKNVDAPFGPVHAMLIRAGRDLTTAYIYTEALPEDVISARLRWKQGNGEWQTLTDDIYPYEFSPALKDDDGDFACVFEIEDTHQKILSSPVISLTDGPSEAKPVGAPPALAVAPLPTVSSASITANPPLSDDFVEYFKKAANPDNYGLRDGRYYPYSTPLGRRIAWRQQIWDKALYADGCTPQEAEVHLRADLARSQEYIKTLLASRAPPIDYAKLDQRQRETLLDLACTEGTLRPEITDAVIAQNWDDFAKNVLYARYAGHAPDHVRNKAFAQRWNIE